MRWDKLPISIFALVLGFTGFTLSCHKIEQILSLSFKTSFFLLGISLALFFSISTLYIIKIIRYPREVYHEFCSPETLNFFPVFSICLQLFSIILLDLNPAISRVLWLSGASIHLLFSLIIISFWMHYKTFDIITISPIWFIPAVGNILIPIAGIHYANVEILWFFFSIGIIFWLVLFIIVFYRMVFHQPIIDKLLPTYFILIAPPAIGAISYLKLVGGELDSIVRILYYFSLFMLLLLVGQFKFFLRLKFTLSWWAYSFPIAAVVTASLVMYQKTGFGFFKMLACGLFFVLVMLITLLVAKTVLFLKKILLFSE